MALYRWRQSTIETVYDTETKGAGDRFIIGDYSGTSGYVYYSQTFTDNRNGTVTLDSPQSKQLVYGGHEDFDAEYYISASETTNELFQAASSYDVTRVLFFGDHTIRVLAKDSNGDELKNTNRYYNFRKGPGTFLSYVYTTSSDAYPNGGAQGGYWYDQRTSITVNITIPAIVMEGNDIPVSWSAVSGTTEYFLERQADSGAWTQIYSGSSNSYTDTAGDWSNVKYRLRMTISGVMTPYVESGTCQVVSDSTLAISGTDGDLGTLTSDVEYKVISTGTSAITVTEEVEGVYTKTFTATAGATNKISVLDLLTGTGSIHITASTNPGSGVIEVERAWTYSKAAAEFPASGSTAQLSQGGAPIWPLTLAECVRLPGGKTLDEVTAFPCQVYSGSYVGTGTYGSGNPNSLTFNGSPKIVFMKQSPPSGSNPGKADVFLIYPGTSFVFDGNGSMLEITVQWTQNGVSWYSNNAMSQFNESGDTYVYAAIIISGGAT